MGYQIIKQPNGLYAIFSSFRDRIQCYNCSAEAVVLAFAQYNVQSVRRDVQNIIDQLDAGQRPYFQHTLTWNQALRYHSLGEREKLKAAGEAIEEEEEVLDAFSQVVSGAISIDEARSLMTQYMRKVLEKRTEEIAMMVDETGIYDVVNIEMLAAKIRSLDSPVTLAIGAING